MPAAPARSNAAALAVTPAPPALAAPPAPAMAPAAVESGPAMASPTGRPLWRRPWVLVLYGFILCYLAGAGTVLWLGRAALFATQENEQQAKAPTSVEPTKSSPSTAPSGDNNAGGKKPKPGISEAVTAFIKQHADDPTDLEILEWGDDAGPWVRFRCKKIGNAPDKTGPVSVDKALYQFEETGGSIKITWMKCSKLDPWGERRGPGETLVPDDDSDVVRITKKTGPEPFDSDNRISLAFTDETQRFGIGILKLRDPRYPEKVKLLTRYQRGDSNNTSVKLDTFEYLFGRESPGVGIQWKHVKKAGRVAGVSVPASTTLKEWHPVENGKVNERKWMSTMHYEKERIDITQTVEIVVGEQTRLFDTALVTYHIRNGDDQPHTVGLRAMIDTYIGLTDGEPFFIPPTEDNPQPQLIGTKIELLKARVPQFIRVLENDSLNDPNATVAELGLKIKGYEDMDKLVICRWPQEWGASEARWDWPYTAMNEPADRDKDSCVVLYWPKATMARGEERRLGYTYGLGRVGSVPGEETFLANSQGKIKLFIGPARKGRPFVATAYVKKASGQNCTLKLPAGVKFVNGEKDKKVVPPEILDDKGNGYAVVTWRCEAAEAGSYTLDAVLNDGADAKANARVLEESIFN